MLASWHMGSREQGTALDKEIKQQVQPPKSSPHDPPTYLAMFFFVLLGFLHPDQVITE